MSPLSRLRCRLVSRTTITLATVGIATAVAPVGLAVATPMAAGPAVAAVTQVLTVGAYADAHIQQATPSTNFGASTTLQADSGSGVTKRIYLKFVVSGVPADASLSVARLRMTATNSSGAVVSAKPGSHNNWSESGVKWSNAPVYGLRTDNSPAVAAGPVEWDLSSYVSGNGVYSVILTQASSTQTSFRSSESAQPPELELTYTTGVPSSDPVIVAAGRHRLLDQRSFLQQRGGNGDRLPPARHVRPCPSPAERSRAGAWRPPVQPGHARSVHPLVTTRPGAASRA